MVEKSSIDIQTWNDQGYQPLIFSHDWQVAILNWEPPIDLKTLSEIERHNHSDEVFVLVQGKALLFVHPEGKELDAVDMQPGVVYNIPQATWHNLIATKDVKLVIVENRNTHTQDTEIRPLSSQEKNTLDQLLPDWAKKIQKGA